MPPVKLFITGEPGCGKTTALRAVVDQLRGTIEMCGFLTEELLEGGKRRGFQGRTLDGETFVLADRKSTSSIRVGPYGVELEGLERIGVPALVPSETTGLVILDEVGKMEAFSPAFKQRVEALLDEDLPLLATVALHGVGFVKRMRNHRRVELMRMNRRNREAVVGQILRRLEVAGIKAKRRIAKPRGDTPAAGDSK